MHQRVSQAVTIMLIFMLILTGCTSQAYNIGLAKEDKNGKAADTGFTVTSAGDYDSADTAIIMSLDAANSCVVFQNMETAKQYTLYYDGTTYIMDKYEGPMTISQLKAGDIVDVKFLKGKRRIASIQMSPSAWTYDNIESYDFGGINKTASIGSTTYSLPDDVVVLSGGKRVEVMDIVNKDVVTVRGIDHKIYSINVEKGHGYLRLKNEQPLIGGWIEVGNSVIKEITEDMLLVVPEGSYQVVLSNGGINCTKDVTIERDKEVVLDLSDIEIAEDKTGRILFSVTPENATVSIDGKTTDISSAVELPYGIHQVRIEADGYISLTKYIQVGSEYAKISFALEEEPEEKPSVSQNAIAGDYTENKDKEPESVSENTISATKGNKVYIDSPKGVEVYLDSNYVGISPVSFKKVVGSHTITLSKNGYKKKSYTIYLYNDGEDVTYSFSDLEKEGDTVSGNSTLVSFDIKPSNVVLTVDNADWGSKRLGELSQGSHTVGIEADGYIPMHEEIRVTALKTGEKYQEFTYELKKAAQLIINKAKPETESSIITVHARNEAGEYTKVYEDTITDDSDSPITIELPYGTYYLSASSDNYNGYFLKEIELGENPLSEEVSWTAKSGGEGGSGGNGGSGDNPTPSPGGNEGDGSDTESGGNGNNDDKEGDPSGGGNDNENPPDEGGNNGGSPEEKPNVSQNSTNTADPAVLASATVKKVTDAAKAGVKK